MVGPGRLELPTSRLSGVRSNHLSYGPPTCWSAGLLVIGLATTPRPVTQKAGRLPRPRTLRAGRPVQAPRLKDISLIRCRDQLR
jgi:hypothetical protein